MDFLGIRSGGPDTELVATDRLASGMVASPCDRVGLGTRIQFTGPGVFTGLALANGVAALIRGIDLSVANPGGGIGGGTLNIQYSRPKYPEMNIAADDLAGTYSGVLLPLLHVPAMAAGGFQVFNLLGGIPHATIPFTGTNLVRIVSTLAVTDTAEIIVTAGPFKAASACA